jgi:hypothetical protein
MMAMGVATVVSGSLFAVQGISSAETLTRFRLSQSSVTMASVCVQTDLQRQCTGNRPVGHSEIYDIKFNDPSSFECDADVVGSDPARRLFSINEFKECKLEGIASGTSLKLVRPNGSES